MKETPKSKTTTTSRKWSVICPNRAAPLKFGQFTIGFLLKLTFVVAVLCSLGVYIYRELSNWQSPPKWNAPGPITDRKKWPPALKSIIGSGRLEEVGIHRIRVHCLARNVWDDEHVWQHDATPELLKSTIEYLSLNPVNKNSQDAKIFWQRVPASWCTPTQVSKPEFYARQPYTQGCGGSHCVLMYDKERELMTVWYRFVF